MNRTAVPLAFFQVERAAPQHPPCFQSQAQWVSYLSSSQDGLKRDAQRPFFVSGCEVNYRPSFNFCRECLPSYAREMACAGKCSPAHFQQEAVCS